MPFNRRFARRACSVLDEDALSPSSAPIPSLDPFGFSKKRISIFERMGLFHTRFIAGEPQTLLLQPVVRCGVVWRMPAERNRPKRENFNQQAQLPFQLRLEDFEIAMQDVYDLFYDVNSGLLEKGLERLDDFLRPAIMSGLLSDLLTASIAKHARTLTQNGYFNGHPDLVVKGVYPDDSVQAGTEGVEIKTTRKSGGAVDTHGARDQWMAVFVYDVDKASEPARERRAMTFREIYLGKVEIADFRKNPRGELGTRTATLHKDGILKLRRNWIYREERG